jgi:hypothetical protein
MEQNAFLPQPTVLLYQIADPGRAARIRAWLDRTGIRAVEVAPTELHHSLGALLELPGFARESGLWMGEALAQEMLVMFAFRGTMLSDFLRFFREEGLPPVALKAMVTPTNVNWSSLELFEALRQEHAQLNR